MKKYTITIGTTYNKRGERINHLVSPLQLVDEALQQCARLFDDTLAFEGWTMVETFGNWYDNERAEWVSEKGLQIVIYSDFYPRYFKHVARYIGQQFDQDTAVLSVEDTPETHFLKC